MTDIEIEAWRQSYIARGWKHEKCGCCVNGVAASYNDGSPEECRDCAGNGKVWITPKGRHVVYPGGPFV